MTMALSMMCSSCLLAASQPKQITSETNFTEHKILSDKHYSTEIETRLTSMNIASREGSIDQNWATSSDTATMMKNM